MRLLYLFWVIVFVPITNAQSGGYIDQEVIADLLDLRFQSIDHVPEVFYTYHIMANERGNNALARNAFYRTIGEGDTQLGNRRSMLVELVNRRMMQTYTVGDTIIFPTQFELDFRAYSPFPRYYAGGREFDKLFIMDKTIQAFAAYEYGQLMRWGIINTGDPTKTPTPRGRFNFNWREEYRVSSESPDDEPWEMYWVMNFHADKGMHVHQYEMPTGGPLSHGCVRLIDADAKWVYEWGDTWKTTSRAKGIASVGAKILEQGTTVLIIGTEPEGKPQPFRLGHRYPVLKLITLPTHPYDVPPGTAQQVLFDKQRSY